MTGGVWSLLQLKKVLLGSFQQEVINNWAQKASALLIQVYTKKRGIITFKWGKFFGDSREIGVLKICKAFFLHFF